MKGRFLAGIAAPLAVMLTSCGGGGSSGGGSTPIAAPAPTPAPAPAPTPVNDPNPLPVPVGPVLALHNNVAIFGDSLAYNLRLEFQAQVSANVDDRGTPQTSGGTLTDYLVYPDKSRTLVIWTGHNNFRDPDAVVNDIAGIVAAIGHDRYIVVGLVFEDQPDERTGGAARPLKEQVNARLAAAYGDRFIDTPALMKAWANPNNAQDRIDLANGVTPSTLRYPGDLIHLRRESGERVLMNAIRAVLVAKGW